MPSLRRGTRGTPMLFTVAHSVAVALLVCTAVTPVNGNYAQFSGAKGQNIARQARAPHTGLWGHAIVAVPGPLRDSPEERLRDFGTNVLVVLGGDKFDAQSNVGVLTNEVFYTRNLEWRVVESLRQRTHYGALFPKVVSQVEWLGVLPPGVVVPATADYKQYLCCVTTTVAPMWPCAPVNGQEFLCDPFLGTRRWAPRRDHQAVALGRALEARLVVFGGRARVPNTNAPEEYLIGGAVPKGPGAVIREVSTLMNDVWVSEDFTGATWTLRTPGCSVHTAQFMGHGEVYCDTTHECYAELRLGTDGRQPGGTVQCVDHTCVCTIWTPRERFAATVAGATSSSPTLYIAGGVTEVSKQTCGRFRCGGGNRIFLNDVWRSDDEGATWSQVAPHDPTAGFTPRGEHVLFLVGSTLWVVGGRGGDVDVYARNPLFNDVWTSADSGATWTRDRAAAEWSPRAAHVVEYNAAADEVVLFGGEEFVPPSPSPSPLAPRDEVTAAAAQAPVTSIFEPVVDVADDDGAVAGGGAAAAAAAAADTTTATDADAGGDAASTTTAATDPLAAAPQERVHGEAMRSLGDTWVLANASRSAAGVWLPDYSTAMGNGHYVWPQSPLTHAALNLSDALVATLAAAGMTTLQDFAHAKAADILPLKALVDAEELCYQKARLEKISYTCENQHVPYDGEFITTLTIIEGSASLVRPTRLEVYGCDGPHPDDIPEEATDLDCRQQPLPRRAAASAMVLGRMFVSGGYSDLFTLNDDVWYRDATPPVTQITTFPESGSSDTVFSFVADECRFEDSCLYEYRLFNEENGNMDRNWSRATSPLDYNSWLPGGVYRIEFRGIDAAGNRDQSIEQGRNAYTWRYTPPLPWLLIILAILVFIIICIAVFVWYRRRKRRLALERYALKRARRRLKAAKAGDWRSHFEAGGAKKRRRKKRDGKKGKKGKKGKGRSKSKSKGKGKGKSKKKKKM